MTSRKRARLFYRSGHYYTRLLNAVFQVQSVFDPDVQDGPGGLGWTKFIYTERPWHRIRIITKMP